MKDGASWHETNRLQFTFDIHVSKKNVAFLLRNVLPCFSFGVSDFTDLLSPKHQYPLTDPVCAKGVFLTACFPYLSQPPHYWW